jgi:hypothetical protein
MLESDGTQLGSGKSLESPIEGGDRGTGGGNDDNFVGLKGGLGYCECVSDKTGLTMARESDGDEKRVLVARRDKSMVLYISRVRV